MTQAPSLTHHLSAASLASERGKQWLEALQVWSPYRNVACSACWRRMKPVTGASVVVVFDGRENIMPLSDRTFVMCALYRQIRNEINYE